MDGKLRKLYAQYPAPATFENRRNGALVAAERDMSEVTGHRVFAVTGSDGHVHVVVTGPAVSICTCMSGKTRPNVRCKHQCAAELIIRAEEEAGSR